MKELFLQSTTIGVVISLIGYILGMELKKRWKLAIFNPLLISIVFVICFLMLFHIDNETYQISGKYLGYLLTPATICLAVPLYEQFEVLKANIKAVLWGILSAILVNGISIFGLSLLFRLDHKMYVSLLPKSITTAIGMGVSEELGGYVTITVAVIIVTGIWGNMIAEHVCKLFRIKDPVAKGIAIGSSSHAIGTTKAMELGEVEGAMSSLSIVVTGLSTLVAANLFAMLL